MHMRVVYQYFDVKNRGGTIADGGFARLCLNYSGRYNRTWGPYIGRVPILL